MSHPNRTSRLPGNHSSASPVLKHVHPQHARHLGPDSMNDRSGRIKSILLRSILSTSSSQPNLRPRPLSSDGRQANYHIHGHANFNSMLGPPYLYPTEASSERFKFGKNDLPVDIRSTGATNEYVRPILERHFMHVRLKSSNRLARN